MVWLIYFSYMCMSGTHFPNHTRKIRRLLPFICVCVLCLFRRLTQQTHKIIDGNNQHDFKQFNGLSMPVIIERRSHLTGFISKWQVIDTHGFRFFSWRIHICRRFYEILLSILCGNDEKGCFADVSRTGGRRGEKRCTPPQRCWRRINIIRITLDYTQSKPHFVYIPRLSSPNECVDAVHHWKNDTPPIATFYAFESIYLQLTNGLKYYICLLAGY